jgi:copper(I)-binding protein
MSWSEGTTMRRLLLLCCCFALPAGAAVAQADDPITPANLNSNGAPVVTMNVPQISVTAGWVPNAPMPQDVPGYLTIHNAGYADQLIGASCGGAQGTTLDEYQPKRPKNPGLAPMGSKQNPILLAIAVPAKSTVTLQPHGLHLVLQDMQSMPKPGEQIECILQFRDGGPMNADLLVRAAPPETTAAK